MGFEKFEAGTGRGISTTPEASIRRTGGIGINKAAMNEWFEDTPAVFVYMDEDEHRIGIEPIDERESGSYVLSVNNGSGTVNADAFLTRYDLETETTTRYSVTWDDDHGMMVVDLDDPVGTVERKSDSDAEAAAAGE